MNECFFCNKLSDKSSWIAENNSCVALFDGYPVNKGHILIISKRHAKDFFALDMAEQKDMIKLLNKCKVYLDKNYKPDGYNVGLNCGTAAGQSIMHVHMHLIPRYTGDVENPRGGVRGVIPNKMNY